MLDLLQEGVLQSSCQVIELQLAVLQILEKGTSCKATENANGNLGSPLVVLNDAESWKGRNIGDVSLEGCSQILKETGRIENLVRIDNLVTVTESSPIYR